jgi:multicomponent Na+:H+ antiporter subunit B
VNTRTRRIIFLFALAGFTVVYLAGLRGLPGFGDYKGPYGFIIDAVSVKQTHATGLVSAVNFFYRGFDTVGEEFILFIAAVGVATVLRNLRAKGGIKDGDITTIDPPTKSSAVRLSALAMTGPTVVVGWWLSTHAQTNPSGGFQGGLIVATAFVLIYLAGHRLTTKRVSPVDLTDAIEAVGAGGFVFIGVAGLAAGAAYLSDVMPLGKARGAVNSSGTIVTISCFVGLEVAAAFLLIVSELVEQTLLVQADGAS